MYNLEELGQMNVYYQFYLALHLLQKHVSISLIQNLGFESYCK